MKFLLVAQEEFDITATGTYKEEPTPNESMAFQISVNGLQGGHSGMDIHKGLGNANKIMNRPFMGRVTKILTWQLQTSKEGGLRNAIPKRMQSHHCTQ